MAGEETGYKSQDTGDVLGRVRKILSGQPVRDSAIENTAGKGDAGFSKAGVNKGVGNHHEGSAKVTKVR